MSFFKYFLCLSVLLCKTSSNIAQSKINTQNITIARDSFGVPHIFAQTDAEAAYGLAWAHSEDDFKNIQYNLLAGKNRLGRVLGKEGVLFDFALQFLNIDSIVTAQYDQEISPEFQKVLEGYTQGINAYAANHPKEVLCKKAFPFTAKDLLKGMVLQTTLLGGTGMALKAINDRRIDEYYQINDVGSNAMAIRSEFTDNGNTFLAINSHQPLEGRFGWYEAHIQSNEGWNIIGGLFPGGATIFVGTNQHLGWAHTTNYHQFGDIYKIKTHSKNKKQYELDHQWVDFGIRKVKLKIKIAGIPIPVSRKVKITAHGPTFKNKDGLYAVRFPAATEIRATDQWYRMNKATNFNEFESAVKMQAIPLFNIVYADKDNNVFLHSGGRVALRDASLNWRHPVDGTSSDLIWSKIVPYETMPTVLNPECGFVYNCNQSPLMGAGAACEWKGDFVGLHRFVYNRGERFKFLLESHKGKFSWNDFHRIKFDKSYHFEENASYLAHFKHLFQLDEKKYPDLEDAIQKVKKWNRSGDVDNREAALMLVFHDYLIKKKDVPFAFFMIAKEPVSEAETVEALRHAKKFLLKTHGSIDVPLGQVQRHIRGDVSIPASGLREVPRAADGKLYDKKKGIYRVTNGDGYMQMVQFNQHGVARLQSINAYGASSKKDSPHFTDQMEMFQAEKFKEMTFDKASILKNAVKTYHPGT